jgi:hypothetical protein
MIGYDPDAVIQDADMQMAELEAEAAALSLARKRGACTHGSAVGLGSDGKAHYPQAEGLTGTQMRCWDCEEVFADLEDWMDTIASILEGEYR